MGSGAVLPGCRSARGWQLARRCCVDCATGRPRKRARLRYTDAELHWLHPAYIAMVAMSMYGCLYLLLGIDAKGVAERFDPGTPLRAPTGFLMLLSVGLGAAWISMILADLSRGKMPSRVDQVV